MYSVLTEYLQVYLSSSRLANTILCCTDVQASVMPAHLGKEGLSLEDKKVDLFLIIQKQI